MVSYNIDLNVKEITPIDTGIQVTQGDYGQMQFLIRVRDNDTYIMDATKAELVFNLPDGYVVVGEASINAGTYTYTFKGNELQSAGKVSAVLTLTYANGRVSSCGFTFNCRYNPLYDRRLNAGAYIPVLEKIVEQAKGQINYLEALIEQLQGAVGETALTRADLISDGREIAPGLAAMDASMATKLFLKKDVVSQIVNDANKAASAAALYSVKQTVDKVNSELDGITIGVRANGFDCDTLLNGLLIATNLVNGPDLGWWLIISIGDLGSRKQLAYDLENNQTPKTRRFAGGVKTNWEPLK